MMSQTSVLIDKEAMQQAIDALDIAQALLEKSSHHPTILAAYKALTSLQEPVTARFDDGFLVEWSEPIADGTYWLQAVPRG